jgi:long-subunit acyl-CoA synthetase (AMP-forming)
VTNQEIAKKFILLGQKKKLLRHVILVDCAEVPKNLSAVEVPGLKFHAFAKLCQQGREAPFNCNDEYLPSGELSSIRYTSGSTGRPKVLRFSILFVLCFLNLVCFFSDLFIFSSFGSSSHFQGVMIDDRNLNDQLMPLQRILIDERCTFCFSQLSHSASGNSLRTLVGGGKVGLLTRALDDTFFEDICLLKPTSLSCVPRIWENIIVDYQAKLQEMREAHRESDLEDEAIEMKCLKYFQVSYFGGEIETLGTGKILLLDLVLPFILLLCFFSVIFFDSQLLIVFNLLIFRRRFEF